MKRLIKHLNEAGHEYMFTGATAASYYGTPRTTMDIDIIVKTTDQTPHELTQTLKEAGLETHEDKIRAAQETGNNLVTLPDTRTPYTVDIILSQEPLERRGCILLDQPTYIQTPEALILAKLRMIKATLDPGKKAKDRHDIQAIMRYTDIDLEKVKEEAGKENTLKTLENITIDIK